VKLVAVPSGDIRGLPPFPDARDLLKDLGYYVNLGPTCWLNFTGNGVEMVTSFYPDRTVYSQQHALIGFRLYCCKRLKPQIVSGAWGAIMMIAIPVKQRSGPLISQRVGI
jgi:hypothetical protein